MRIPLGQALNVMLLGGATLLAGCGANGPELIPVSGTVTMEGKAMEKIRVEFHPVDVGGSSTALTDAEGKFTLRTLKDQRDGAVAGRHKVVMYDTTLIDKYVDPRLAANMDLTQGRKSRISTKYMDKMATPVQVDVSANSHQFDFEVEPNPAASTGTSSTPVQPFAGIDRSDPRSVRAAEAQAEEEGTDN